MKKYCDFTELEGETPIQITKTDNSILFEMLSGVYYLLEHEQECCENVYIEDIDNDLNCLIDNPILYAEESNNTGEICGCSETWTFFKLSTIKGGVTIRFYGTSSGYYSEDALLTKSYVLSDLTGLEH